MAGRIRNTTNCQPDAKGDRERKKWITHRKIKKGRKRQVRINNSVTKNFFFWPCSPRYFVPFPTDPKTFYPFPEIGLGFSVYFLLLAK